MEPRAELLRLPEAYGRPTRVLPWSAVRERLERAPRYWLVTIRPDGSAHVVAVDGLWLDDTWFYGGSPQTLHQRNVEQDPNVVVHLEDAAAVVVVEGRIQRRMLPPDETTRHMAASQAKYGYAPTPQMYAAGVWALRPDRARAWSSFPTDATRYVFTARSTLPTG